MNRNFLLRLAALTLAVAFVLPASGQTTTGDPAVSAENLERMLLPLTQDELVLEADAWIAVVAAQVREISAAEIAASAADAVAGGATSEMLAERQRLIARAEVAVAALREKGGDVTTYDQYLAAVSGLAVDVRDTGAIVGAVRDWFTSSTGGLLWATRIAFFLVLLVSFRVIAAIIAGVVKRAVSRLTNTSELLRSTVVNITRQVTMIIGVVVALGVLGVDIGPLVAALGVAGFVIGFALQGTLSNFASGVMILIYRPYDVGDVINVVGTTGKVSDMTLVSTTLLTFDNQIIVVPNNSIWGGIITNITGNDTRRVDMTFGIGYGDDIDKARGILETILSEHAMVLKSPEPLIKLHELADSSVNFIVRPWSKTSDYWDVYWDVTRAVKDRFDAAGVSIPYPQQDVHVHTVA